MMYNTIQKYFTESIIVNIDAYKMYFQFDILKEIKNVFIEIYLLLLYKYGNIVDCIFLTVELKFQICN